MLTIFMAAAIAIAAPQAPGQAAGSVTVRDITYKQLDGTDNAATLVMPASGPRAPRPAILFVHWYEPPKPSSNRAEFLPDALELARDGVVSLLIDTPWSREDWFATRNNGGASGTERAGAARGSAASLSERPEGTGAQRRRRAPGDDYDFSVRYVKELRRALDVLLQQPDIDRTRVAYVGHDFGAMYGALAVAADPRITHFVYMAGTKSFSDWFLLTPKREGADRDAFIAKLAPLDPIAHLPKISPRPVLMQFGGKDRFVSAEAAKAQADAVPGPKTVKMYETAEHELTYQARLDRIAWLKEQLRVR